MSISRLIAVGTLTVVLAAVGVATASPSAAKPCQNRQLTAQMTHIFGSEGAGNTGYRLTLKNSSRRGCWVHRHLALQLLGAGAVPRKLPTHVVYFGRRGVVTVAPARTVSARLRFSPDIPGKGEPGRGPCEPAAHRVIVFLGPPKGGGVTGSVKPPTSVCEHGTMEEQPFG
jgi:hypothetical protein